MAKKLLIDPPFGWKYGFPKVYDNPKGLSPTEWCFQNGYPRHELNSKGECDWVRFIEIGEEDED